MLELLNSGQRLRCLIGAVYSLPCGRVFEEHQSIVNLGDSLPE